MTKTLFFIPFYFFIYSFCFSQVKDTIALSLDICLADFPYQNKAILSTGGFLKSYSSPSMNQSLQLSTDFYSSLNYGVKELIKVKNNKLNFALTQIVAGGLDYFVSTVPFGVAWNHEEFHRAVMTKNNISSYNEVYELNLFAPTIAVSQVLDEDLMYLNDNNQVDFIRLMSAGSESSIAQIQLMQKNNFYNNSQLPNLIFYWHSILGNAGYIKYTSSEQANVSVEEEKLSEDTDIRKRDFTGPDFSAWAYALFNPNGLYSDRGVHPSGVGIDRAISPNQLTNEARAYLNKQGNLSFFNLISPHLFGVNKIKLFTNDKGTYYGNMALRHNLTSFGNDLSLDLFYQTPSLKLFGAIHSYNNYNNHFMGLEGGLIDKGIVKNKVLLSATAMMWTQPKNQSFYESKHELGGLLKAKVHYNKHVLKPYVEVIAKTKGWVSTNVFLEDNLSVNFGVRYDVR